MERGVCGSMQSSSSLRLIGRYSVYTMRLSALYNGAFMQVYRNILLLMLALVQFNLVLKSVRMATAGTSLALVLLILPHLICCDKSNLPTFQVIIILPNITVDSDPLRQSWQSGDQLMRGAISAVDDIHQCFPFQINVAELITDTCSSHSSQLTRFVKYLVENQDQRITIAVVGVFCKDNFMVFSRIARKIGLIQISCAVSPLVKNKTSRHYNMLPSTSAYADAMIQFMTHSGWTRIAVVYTLTSNAHYFELAENVIKVMIERGFPIPFCVEIAQHMSIHYVLRSLKSSGTKIVHVILPPKEASLLICMGYNFGLQWPEYGWIVPDISLQNILNLHNVSGCNEKATQGIITVKIEYKNTHRTVSNCSSSGGKNMHTNIYAHALYHSIYDLAIALNNSLSEVQYYFTQSSIFIANHIHQRLMLQKRVASIIEREFQDMSFHNELGQMSFETFLSIHQILAGNESLLGQYNLQNKVISFENYSSSQIPNDKLELVYILFPPVVVVLLGIAIAMCTALTLFNTFLFVYYRNEPEVKASSYYISLFIFIGCYCAITGTVSLVIYSSTYGDDIYARYVHCSVTSSSGAISFTLVFSTLLVRSLRIYRVFSYMGRLKKSCSNATLAAVILLIVFGNSLIFVIWAATDLYILKDIEFYHSDARPPYYEVVQHCQSEHSAIFLTLSYLYVGVVMALLAYVMFKTRKIHRENFRDTKKVNALIFTYIIVICIVSSLWSLLRGVGDPTASKSVLIIGYLAVPFGCNVYLFFPKTLIPLRRSITKQWTKPQSTYGKLTSSWSIAVLFST